MHSLETSHRLAQQENVIREMEWLNRRIKDNSYDKKCEEVSNLLKIKFELELEIIKLKNIINNKEQKMQTNNNQAIVKQNEQLSLTQMMMHQKTIIKRLLNRYIVEVDDAFISQDAINVDQSVIENGAYKYIDNPRSSEHQESVAQLEKAFAEYTEDSNNNEDDDDYDAIENFVKNDYNDTEMFKDKTPSAQVD
jgi:hypothetical protein